MANIPKRSLYRHVADVLRTAIDAGEYPWGSPLPREDQLAEELDVSRATVNDAVRVLVAEGLVRVHRGVGMFIQAIPPIERNAEARYSTDARERGGGAFDVEVSALGLTPRVSVTVDRVVPPAAVAEVLNVSAQEASTVSRLRLMGADDIPLQIATSYIPAEIAAGTAIEQRDTGPGGIISRFAELGYAQVRFTEDIAVRPPSAQEVASLAMTEDQRVYEIFHVGWTEERRAVEVCLHVMPTHFWKLKYGWTTK